MDQMRIFLMTFSLLLIFSCNVSETNHDLDEVSEFEIEEGFQIQCVAKHPLVTSPVNIHFDENGKAWVIELKSYMSDIDGLNEEEPNCRIKILSDTNQDGIFDHYEIFLDSLTLPRGVLPVYEGVLVALPPALWYYDKSGKDRHLVDSTYAVGGNVEHQANGLIKGIDNWIYSAKSDKRYKKINNEWVIEYTRFRGQWGIDQDDYGRLYYNHNSILLQTEFFPPNTLGRYTNFFYPSFKQIVPDVENNDRLFPIQSTLGVNRAYEDGILDSLNRLKYCTSCCGISVMGSNNFGNTYENSVFIAETSANLVKRLKLNFQEDGLQKIDNPYVESEFLRSKNELFRPVYTATGNDGDLYVVDMNKGVIQHVTYLTNYLRKYVKEKHLDTIIDQGRIFKISKINNTKSNHINLSNLDDDAIIQLLQHPNRSVRTHAQWNIAGLKKSHLIPQLSDLFKKDIKDFTKIHILYTLHALAGLNKEVLESACQDSNPHIKRLGISLSNLHNVDVSLLFGKLTTFEKYVFLAGQAEYIHKNPNKAIKIVPFLDEIAKDTVLSAILAGKVWENNTNQTIHSILPHLENKSSILYNFLKTNPTKTENKNENIAHLNLYEKELYRDGEYMFKKICASCHNIDGSGITSLAPTLIKSSIVNNTNISIPIRTLLYGVEVKLGTDRKYGAAMTGLVDNEAINNGNIAALLTYIRNSWGNKSGAITLEQVSKERKIVF